MQSIEQLMNEVLSLPRESRAILVDTALFARITDDKKRGKINL